MIRKCWFIVALTFAGWCACRAVIIADWTFETSAPNAPTGTTAGPYNAESGVYSGSTSQASGLHASSSTTWPSNVGNGSTHSFNSDHWASGDYYQFTTSSVGYNSIMITLSAVGSSTGPKNFKLDYSTDGITFFDSGYTYSLVSSPTWSSSTTHSDSTENFSFYLTSITALNNDAAIYFRLIDTSATTGGAINGGDVGISGASRVDDFAISGEIAAVPEPAAAGAIAGVWLLALCGWRVWRQSRCGEKLKS
jgi:hypothetical protein